jgi:tRNA (guanine37-N1)-methyltransferase
MERPCVTVPREAGEATRGDLAAAGLLDRSFEIQAAEGRLFLPVSDAAAAREAGFEVVDREVPVREAQQMPADLLGSDPSYERLGDIVVIDEDDPERARAVAEAVVASDLPVKTVVNRASKVSGEHRVREWDVLAGDGTETVHREYGFEYHLDIATVYFSPRLATERHRVAQQVTSGEHAFDMFAGVGPFAVPFAARGAEVVAVDTNPAAVEYLRENVARNGVADRVTVREGDVRAVAPEYDGWADRVVMNLPHSADAFLGVAVELAGEGCVLHYYDIQPDDDPFGPGEQAVRDAAGGEYTVEVRERRVVRSYAPHEVNVCLDVRLSQ